MFIKPIRKRLGYRCLVLILGLSTAMVVSITSAADFRKTMGNPTSAEEMVVNPAIIPQFETGYEPDEVAATPSDAHTWMVFQNTSLHTEAYPWSMSVYYENPGSVMDRYAKIVPDPTNHNNPQGNYVLHYWLHNAVIDSGYQHHTKGRIQTGFPGQLNNAVELYARQRILIHEDMNLLHAYPSSGDPWWIGIIIQEFWLGAAWEGHPNPARINLTLFPYNGEMFLQLRCESGPVWQEIWSHLNIEYAIPVGEWVLLEVGYKMGDADHGRMVVVVTPQSTGKSQVLFNITNWTYDEEADLPGGIGPVPLSHWNPQKLYTSDNVIHFIRDQGGTAQIYFDDFAFSGIWPINFLLTRETPD